MKILFLHGWNSVVGGVKPTYLKDHGHEVINPALPHEDFAEAVRIAQAEFDKHQPQVVVGSSRGGAVAMNINSGDARLVLLCPAWRKYGSARTVKTDTVILHSRADDVVTFADSEELAKNSGATLIEFGNDHRLADPEPLAALLRACEEYVLGSDFGAPATAGQQAKKVILIEAARLGERSYAIRPTGRNSRLRTTLSGPTWRDRRPGWTIPELAESMVRDRSTTVAAFDFPFSIPLSLLEDPDFARAVGQEVFGRRVEWAKFVSNSLRLSFTSSYAKGRFADLSSFKNWRDQPGNPYWVRRHTDSATGGFPPLQDRYQNLFSMTLCGTAMLEQLANSGISAALDSASFDAASRIVFETYPAAVADRCGFDGNYKKEPEKCLQKAEEYLAAQGISLDFAQPVKDFCLTYRTKGKSNTDLDPDGADAFLCLVAAICFREGLVELRCGDAPSNILAEEGCIITPKPLT